MRIPWWLWLWNWIRSERRVCPTCQPNELAAVDAILAPRKRYIGHCPKCGGFWT